MRIARALAPAVLLLAACGRIDKVDVKRSATVTVPGAPGGAALPVDAIGAIPLPIDRTVLQEQGIDPKDVDSARLVGLTLAVTQGSSLEAWLDSATFWIEAPGLARTLLARKSGIRALPSPTTSVALEAPGADLKPFLLADHSTLTVEASGIQPAETTTLEATATIRVDVSVSGVLGM